MGKKAHPAVPGKDKPERLTPSQKSAVAAELKKRERAGLFTKPPVDR